MPQSTSIERNFIRGLVTEATGLNFPENGCTDVDNCVFSIIGDVTRRQGFDLETNFNFQNLVYADQAVSTFKWKNAGGDGETEVLVVQLGSILFFYLSSNSTITNPLSNQFLQTSDIPSLAISINVAAFQAAGNTNNVAISECQYASGNGYLFVYHPDCDPFYCTYVTGIITANIIQIQTRDFSGIPEPGVAGTTNPTTLTPEHSYNLQNQGWTSGSGFKATASATHGDSGGYLQLGVLASTAEVIYDTGVVSLPVGGGLTVTVGEQVEIIVNTLSLWILSASGVWPFSHTTVYEISAPLTNNTPAAVGTINSYDGTNLVINVTDTFGPLYINATPPPGQIASIAQVTVTVQSANVDQIDTWNQALGNYPSNDDIWWEYKDSTGIFNPALTFDSVSSTSPAPQGSYVLNEFNQNRSAVSSVQGLTVISTTNRPSTGTWFEGRVWFTGVDASQVGSWENSAPLFYTWTENIYFSQIITATVTNFGACYEYNNPTDENLFDLLPTDGGVITIQGSGKIYKLFPIQNGMLVFAANGVWFITGSSGIGFTATDYTITKISAVQCITSYSFIDVLGLPIFWNEEGIYAVEPNQQGGLTVNPLTVGTILSFYNEIPLDSKKYARGDYNPITYVLQWIYKSTQETGISDRYQFDSALSLNIYNKAFYPYSISQSAYHPYVASMFYMSYPSGAVASGTAPDPTFKYLITQQEPPDTSLATSVGASASGTTQVSISNVTVPAHSLIVVVTTEGAVSGHPGAGTVSDGNVNTYSLVTSAAGGILSANLLSIFETYNCNALNNATLTFTAGSGTQACSISAFYVTNATTLRDPADSGTIASANSNSSSSISVTSGPTLYSNELFLGAVEITAGVDNIGFFNPTGWVTPPTYSGLQKSCIVAGGIALSQGGAGVTGTYAPTLASAEGWVAIIMGFILGPGSYGICFAEEHDDTNWIDWNYFGGINYTSNFTTGYRLHGGALRKWQTPYIVMYSRNEYPTQYTIQSIIDYAIDGSSGKYSSTQLVQNPQTITYGSGAPTLTKYGTDFGMIYRKHRLRGRGEAIQFNINSVDGKPFDFMGWATLENMAVTV